MSSPARAALLGLALLAPCASALAQTGLGDPTKPTALSDPDEVAAAQAAQGPRWRLQSTLVADTRRVAVINGRTVAQGERVDGAQLVEIRQDGVTLEHEGQRITLRLPGAVNIRRSDG